MNFDELQRRLGEKAFLFDHPDSYAAGVDDALDAVSRMLEWQDIAEPGRPSDVDITIVLNELAPDPAPAPVRTPVRQPG